jgi:hypothetical protein
MANPHSHTTVGLHQQLSGRNSSLARAMELGSLAVMTPVRFIFDTVPIEMRYARFQIVEPAK